jgi:uncharacterized protein
MKIFLDANVLFTAAYNPQGKAFLLIQSNLNFISSDYAIDEARRNLALKQKSALDTFDKLIKNIQVVILFPNIICPIDIADKDKPIFTAAWVSESTHLLTGDIKDFGKYMNKPSETKNIIIQTVSEFLNSL